MNRVRQTHDAAALVWRKSSHSGSDGGDCVEVATAARAFRVRDSKRSGSDTLAFTHEGWGALLGALGSRGRQAS
ncbi:DUF397 domain-containing protein [Yinghuangia seranimata]|uniref:DUF397 domain-containing protein n=1 Tax=Yinghuangia seranimata TaxID=408067 RepID=UPI00248BFA3F|nr:DUF397 domain-containing protein [Yinghuangia seranimata]MDI2132592.1 DUF397 domain-containing protein [Yinghuangia seranimata]